jgi:peptide-methionine (S)-S-oxide reductase
VSTRVGYAGGTSENPTYRNLGDHSETVQIEYDPSQISYRELLDVFWCGHNPTYESESRQYMSIIFYHNDEQKQLAEESRDRLQDETGRQIYTEIVPAAEFYPAEGYHQKYYLQQVPELMRELTTYYPDIEGLAGSTAAARLNGYAGGYGTPDTLEEEMDSLGLSSQGTEFIKGIADKGLVPACSSASS